MSSARAFFRVHYTSLMLAIIVLSVAGSLVMLAFLSASLNQQVIKSNEQIRLLKGVAEEISKDQQRQHDHQDERAACFFNLFVTYTDSRKPITQEEADKCRVFSDDTVATKGPRATPQETSATQAELDAISERRSQQQTEELKATQSEPSWLDMIVEAVIALSRSGQ